MVVVVVEVVVGGDGEVGKECCGWTCGVRVMKPNTCTNVMSAERPQLYLQRRCHATTCHKWGKGLGVAPAFVRLVHETEQRKASGEGEEHACTRVTCWATCRVGEVAPARCFMA